MTYDDVIIRTGRAARPARRRRAPRLGPRTVRRGSSGSAMIVGPRARPRQRVPQSEPSPPLILALLAAFEGMFLGGHQLGSRTTWSRARRPAPGADRRDRRCSRPSPSFAGALFLFRSGKVRVTPKFHARPSSSASSATWSSRSSQPRRLVLFVASDGVRPAPLRLAGRRRRPGRRRRSLRPA